MKHSGAPNGSISTARFAAPSWQRLALAAAAVYNMAWGAWVVLDPGALFRFTGLATPIYPGIWQCVGMIVGVYGVGYAIAASNPWRHWPIVLVGLLGKILGPIGFVGAAVAGELPWSWGWLIASNDLIWWIPFLAILWGARGAALERRPSDLRARPAVSLALRMARSQSGDSLLSLSRRQPRLVVCLRHLGCTFCRESLAELARALPRIEQAGVGAVLVHPASDDARAAEIFGRYGLEHLPRIADPQRILYRALGLDRGSLWQVLGPRVFGRALRALGQGHHLGRVGGDVWQMPGVFVLEQGEVVEAFRHRDVAERPDYAAIALRLDGRKRAQGGGGEAAGERRR